MTTRYGILTDYRFCTGCHTCEVACQMERGLSPDKFGIKVSEIGPWQLSDGSWQLQYFPLLTRECDLCAERVEQGKQPSCVHNCMGDCLRFGTMEELLEIMGEKEEQLIQIPKQNVEQ